LQGSGKRRWQIAKQGDKTFIPDSPLRILQNFKPEQEWVLEPGDMLYLPPNYAHHGIAIGECMTYSIGFRAPSYHELSQEFLVYLQDHIKVVGMYKDPDLKLAKHPAQISNQMIEKVSEIIKKIQFNKKDVEDFLGSYLSEPKSTVFFDAPESPMTKKRFLQLVPIVGVLSSVLLLGEAFQFWKLVAGLLVIGGLCINLLGARLFSTPISEKKRVIHEQEKDQAELADLAH